MTARPYPQPLTKDEEARLLARAEQLWRDLERNQLGGYSGINRPFWIVGEFKVAIEEFGNRDIGWRWSKNERAAALPFRCTEIADQAVPEYRAADARHSGCTSHTAKRWQAAWDAACIALGGDPADHRR